MSEILTILASVGFNWHVALANFVNFLIILMVLNVLFFKKIGSILNERENIIKKSLDDASKAEKLLEDMHTKETLLKSETLKEKNRLLEDAKTHGESIVASMEAEAHAKIVARENALKHKEDTLMERTEEEFIKKAPEIIAALYSKVLMKEMTEAENNALIARMK